MRVNSIISSTALVGFAILLGCAAAAATNFAGTYICEDPFFGTLEFTTDAHYTRTQTFLGDPFVDRGAYRIAGKKVFLTSNKPNMLNNFALDIDGNGELMEGPGGSRCKRK
jgi:hypothetical protein